MKNIVLFFAVLLYLPVFGQPNDTPNRKPEIEILTETVYSATEFQRIADSLQMSVNELWENVKAGKHGFHAIAVAENGLDFVADGFLDLLRFDRRAAVGM